jgi:hypothetical protein
VHALPHVPQLPLSEVVLTHFPEQQVCPPVHAGPPPQVHALFVHPSDVDVEQLLGQETPVPQLSVAGPHAFPLHVVEMGCAVHPHPFVPAPPPPQVLGGAHVLGQVIASEQLFVAGPQALPLHAAVSFGVQHV